MPNPNVAEMHKKSLLSPNIGKHGKNKKTLMREVARQKAIDGMAEMYKSQIIKNMPEIAKANMEEAKKSSGWKDREFVLKHTVGEGKAGENKGDRHLHLHKYGDTELTDIQRKLIEEYEAKLKEVKTQ